MPELIKEEFADSIEQNQRQFERNNRKELLSSRLIAVQYILKYSRWKETKRRADELKQELETFWNENSEALKAESEWTHQKMVEKGFIENAESSV